MKFGEPSETQILIRFRSLRTHSSQRHGISYYSPNKPTFYCKADRKNRIVSFSRHALERIHERTVYNWKTYSGSGDAFAFINNCIYYENCIESQSDQYLVIYNRCTEGFVSYNFLENVIEDFDFNKQYYYRVGYCPIVLDGKFVKAKTFLVPGMRGTPERKLLQSLPIAQQISIEAQIESQLSFHSLVDSGNWTLIKWFHEQGVPQVKSFNQAIFRY